MGIAFAKYPLRHFIRWASYEPVDSMASLTTGQVRSVHLFRGKRGIEHEFVLISFSSSSNISWLRAERAARAKTSTLHPRWDSFGPLFSGVPPLDTLSFSTHKAHLITSKDIELASVLIYDENGPPLSGMFVRELSEQFAATVNDSPDYQLWSTNCRYFARRSIINITARFTVTSPTSVKHIWRGKEMSDLPTFLSKLQDERFGGSVLVGYRASIAKIKTLIHATSANTIDHTGAVKAMDDSLTLIDTLNFDDRKYTVNLTWLRTDCLTAKANALSALGLYEEAYVVAREAIELIRPQDVGRNIYQISGKF